MTTGKRFRLTLKRIHSKNLFQQQFWKTTELQLCLLTITPLFQGLQKQLLLYVMFVQFVD